ncbi:MAG: integrase [Roseiarcus sp.]
MDVDSELASLAIVPRTVCPHLDALGEKAKDYARNARSQNTRRAYESDWRQFSSWPRRQGFPVTPPDPQTVGLYLAACADGTGRVTAMNVASLERRLSGIAWHYRQLGQPLDTQDRHIATVLAGIRRAHGRPPVQKEAIFADDLLAMLATLDNNLPGLRDRASLAIGFAGGLRRSEIAGLDCGPSQSEDGTGWIEIFGAAKGASAAKNEGEDASSARNDGASDVSRAGNEGGLLLTINGKTGWRAVEIGRGSSAFTCPVAMLETWMRLGRIADGPLFRRVIRCPYDYFGLAIFGHQWKPALPLMASRWLARAAHLWPMMSSSSSIVATCLLTMGSSTSAHSVSAGCSSGA